MKFKFITFNLVLVISIFLISVGAITTIANPEFPLKEGDIVKINTGDKINPNIRQGLVSGFDDNLLYIGTSGEIRIDRVVKNDGSSVEFPYIGARYDSVSQAVFGIDQNENQINIPITEIDYVDIILFVQDKQLPTKFYGNTLHKRLRFVSVYPEILYRIPIISINEIKRYKKGSSAPLIMGVLAGGVLGYISVNPKPKNIVDSVIVAFTEPMARTSAVLAGALTGGLIGYFIGKSSWQTVTLDRFKVSFNPIYQNGFGVSLAIKF